VYSLREQEAPGIGTAAVDAAGNLYWDPEFITKIGKEQGAYLILHEVLHLIFDHHSRAPEIIGENPTELQRFVCNVAADLVIEQTLDAIRHLRPDGAVYLGVEVPAWGITLDFPENRSVQEYYRLIMEKLKRSGDNNQQQGDGDGESDSDGSAGSGGEQGDSSASGGDDPDGDGQGDDDMGGEGSDGGAGSPGAGGDADEDGADADGSKSPSGSGAGSPPSGQGSAPPQRSGIASVWAGLGTATARFAGHRRVVCGRVPSLLRDRK